eukprot:6206987-Pleurochrysis_carterae.AAC.4
MKKQRAEDSLKAPAEDSRKKQQQRGRVGQGLQGRGNKAGMINAIRALSGQCGPGHTHCKSQSSGLPQNARPARCFENDKPKQKSRRSASHRSRRRACPAMPSKTSIIISGAAICPQQRAFAYWAPLPSGDLPRISINVNEQARLGVGECKGSTCSQEGRLTRGNGRGSFELIELAVAHAARTGHTLVHIISDRFKRYR